MSSALGPLRSAHDFAMRLQLLVLLTGFALRPIAAQQDAAARFYAERSEEYAAERRAIGRANQPVVRTGGTLRIRLPNREVKQLVDTSHEGDQFLRFVYDSYISDLRIHVVRVHVQEGRAIRLIHAPTGQDTIVVGKPKVSPDRTRFVSSSVDLAAGYEPNALEIWRVAKTGMVREFVLEADSWGPDSVRWFSNTTVRFVRKMVDTTLTESFSPDRVVRSGTAWRQVGKP